MEKQVIVIGAGGHGKVIADIVIASGDRVLGFLDDGMTQGQQINGIPVLGGVEDYVRFPEAEFVIAIGNAAVRRRIAERLQGARWYCAVHPCAVVSEMDVHVGEGTVIMAGAVVNPGAKIGSHCIINTGAIVEHDNRIGDFVHISVGAKLAGTVTIGDDTWIGIGAVVSNNLSVCGGSTVGAGAVVVKNITEPGVYVGVPAGRKL